MVLAPLRHLALSMLANNACESSACGEEEAWSRQGREDVGKGGTGREVRGWEYAGRGVRGVGKREEWGGGKSGEEWRGGNSREEWEGVGGGESVED